MQKRKNTVCTKVKDTICTNVQGVMEIQVFFLDMI